MATPLRARPETGLAAAADTAVPQASRQSAAAQTASFFAVDFIVSVPLWVI